MATKTKAPKTVDVIERVVVDEHKVVYTVRSSNGHDTYETTIIDGRARGCTCPSRVFCYHETQLEAKEVEYANATLPLMGTPEMKALIRDIEKALRPKKVRRSAANVELIARLQVPEGVKARKVRGQAVVKVVAPQKEVVMQEKNVSEDCPVDGLDMSVREHLIEREMRRFEQVLACEGITDYRSRLKRAGSSLKSRSADVLFEELLKIHRAEFEQELDQEAAVGSDIEQATRLGTLAGSDMERRQRTNLHHLQGFTARFGESDLILNATTSAGNQSIEWGIAEEHRAAWQVAFASAYIAAYKAAVAEQDAPKAQIQAPSALPQAPRYENAPLNGNRPFSVLR